MVTSVREAAECMLGEEWPETRGKADIEARETLLAALEGHASIDDARSAFERAAKSAGILMENAIKRPTKPR